MLAGENEQLRDFGSPLQERAMELLEVPVCIAAVTRTLPDLPMGNVTTVGEALNKIVAAGGVGEGGVVTVPGQVGS